MVRKEKDSDSPAYSTPLNFPCCMAVHSSLSPDSQRELPQGQRAFSPPAQASHRGLAMRHRAQGGVGGHRQEQVVCRRAPWSRYWGAQPCMPPFYQAELLLKPIRMRKGCICYPHTPHHHHCPG